MKNQTFNFAVRESTFGGSAAVEVTINPKTNTILFIADKSTNETNWTWDYVPESFNRCIGKTMDDFRVTMSKHNSNLLRGESYRNPHWIEVR